MPSVTSPVIVKNVSPDRKGLLLQAAPEFLKSGYKGFAFALAEIGEQLGDLFLVFRAARGKLGHDFVGKLDDGRAAIGRVLFPFDQSVFFERVDERRHIRRGHAEFFFELAHDPWAAFMNRAENAQPLRGQPLFDQ